MTVTHIKSKAKSSMDVSVIEMLEIVISDLKYGKLPSYNKAIVCLLDDSEDSSSGYDTGFYMAQLKSSESVSLLEATKLDIQLQMAGK